jgi:hypothetical protein
VVEKIGKIGVNQPFFDPTAFATPVGVRYGTSGRNILHGPGTVNLDLGLFKKIPVKERVNVELRIEANNFSNTPHFNNPNSNINAGNFLQVTSAQADQRQMRFSIRTTW